jgi:hypothetical protein
MEGQRPSSVKVLLLKNLNKVMLDSFMAADQVQVKWTKNKLHMMS